MANGIKKLDDNFMSTFNQEVDTFNAETYCETFNYFDDDDCCIQSELITKHLIYMGIICSDSVIIEIGLTPEYEKTKYEKQHIKDYAYNDKEKFPSYFGKIININLENHFIYHEDDIENLEKNNNLNLGNGTMEQRINRALKEGNIDLILEHARDNDGGGFSLNSMAIDRYNNLKRTIIFSGGFTGDNTSISSSYFNTFAYINVSMISGTIDKDPFYKQLLAESYLLLIDENYKLASFIAFTALESFINYIVYEDEIHGQRITLDEKIPLIEKSKKLFEQYNVPRGIDNQLYVESMKEFYKLENYRNDVAHGKGKEEYNKDIANTILTATLYQIIAVDFNIGSFDELHKEVIKENDS